MKREPRNDLNLVIRPFEKADQKAVQALCFEHFRSLSINSVQYYATTHIQDLFVIISIIACVTRSVTAVSITIFLFTAYLFAKAWYELEQYIKWDCSDIYDIHKNYCDGRTSFWVAELVEGTASNPYSLVSTPKEEAEPEKSRVVQRFHSGEEKTNEFTSKAETTSGTYERIIIGCVGLAPSRENKACCKLVRLIVASNYRRQRVGSRLLLQCENHARSIGYDTIKLYTNTLTPSHSKFVRQHGYSLVSTIRRGLMRGDMITWVKNLPALRDTESANRVQILAGTANVFD